MKKFCWILVAVLLLLTGCGGGQTRSTTTEPIVKPADNPVLGGSVSWCRGSLPFDEMIGYSGEWSLQISDEGHWEQLKAEYNLTMDEDMTLDFSKYVILALFYHDRAGSEFELTELAMVDGMATIGIHEKTPGGAETQELVGCVVQLDEQPLEINSYRDEETVG